MIDGRRVSYRPVLSNEPETPEGEDGFPYGRFGDDKNGEYVEPDNMSYSDYSGSTIAVSNVRVFERDFHEWQGQEWWRLWGGHGTVAIVVRRDADARVPEIGEFFEALEQYPIADENDLPNLEQEMQDVAWENYGFDDFKRWFTHGHYDLLHTFPRQLQPIIDTLPTNTQIQLFEALLGIQIEDLDSGDYDSRLKEIWWEGVSNGNGDEIRHEDAVNVYFDFERGVASYLRHSVNPGRLRVALDALHEQGGEWSPRVDELLETEN